MSSTRMSSLLLCAVMLAMPVAASAGVVVASSGPSARDYPVGRKLDDNAQVTLRAGDTLTVLDQKGTRVLRGAGTFPVSQASAPSRASTFAVLTRQRASQRVRTGAVRDPALGGKVTSPNLWYVDISNPGTQCILSADNVRLWRANPAERADYRVSANSGAARATISFAAGATVAPWDAARTPIGNGDRFSIVNPDGKAAGSLTFAVLPGEAAGPEELASMLIEKGCSAQLQLLATSLSVAPN